MAGSKHVQIADKKGESIAVDVSKAAEKHISHMTKKELWAVLVTALEVLDPGKLSVAACHSCVFVVQVCVHIHLHCVCVTF